MDIRDLEAFLSILDSGSISRAAEELGLTQPALSLKLKKIETEFSVSLFQRTPRHMIPTDSAKALEPKVRELLTRFDGLKEAISESMADLKGVVRVGCLMGWFQSLLVPCLPIVREVAPQVRLRLHVDDTEKLLYRLVHGQLDFAIVAQPFENLEGLSMEHLFDEDLVLFSRTLPSGNSEKDRRQSLIERPWITLGIPDPLVEKYWREQFGGRSFPWERVVVPVTTDHITSLPRLVGAVPDAVSVAPRQIVWKAAERGYLQIADSVAHRNGVFLLWRENALALKRNQFLRDTILEQAHAYKSQSRHV
jgi:DNA-binding transcriptional LysR family regulator